MIASQGNGRREMVINKVIIASKSNQARLSLPCVGLLLLYRHPQNFFARVQEGWDLIACLLELVDIIGMLVGGITAALEAASAGSNPMKLRNKLPKWEKNGTMERPTQ